MGIDNAHIFNHNLKFTNAQELMKELEQRLGLPVVNDVYDEDGNRVKGYPEGFDGLVFNTEDGLTVQDYIEKRLLLDANRISPQDDRGFLYLNQYIIENSLPEVYLYRWWQTMHMCKVIRLYGSQTFEDYQAQQITLEVDVMNGPWVLKQRKAIQPHIATFGSTEMLTFCCDHHSEYMDHIAANWSFDDFVSWGKKEFIYVRFEDLANFDFPENKPDCYNVFIHDSFLDLKG